MVRPEGLKDIAAYASGVGVHQSLVSASLVRDAHAAGLLVHVWTLRAENAFLPTNHRRGNGAAAHGDAPAEIAAFLRAGIDGFFTDQADIGVAAVKSPRTSGQ